MGKTFTSDVSSSPELSARCRVSWRSASAPSWCRTAGCELLCCGTRCAPVSGCLWWRAGGRSTPGWRWSTRDSVKPQSELGWSSSPSQSWAADEQDTMIHLCCALYWQQMDFFPSLVTCGLDSRYWRWPCSLGCCRGWWNGGTNTHPGQRIPGGDRGETVKGRTSQFSTNHQS